MAETKFTPGPWVVTGVSMATGNVSVSKREHRIVIAEVTNAASFGDMLLGAMKRGGGSFDAGDCHTQHANAQLIAAAPELYAVVEAFGNEEISDAEFNRMRNAALAKARGEAV